MVLAQREFGLAQRLAREQFRLLEAAALEVEIRLIVKAVQKDRES